MGNFLSHHRNSLAKDILEKGTTNLTMHRIDTDDVHPIKQRFYRTGLKQAEIIKTQLKEMVKKI